MLSSRPIQIPLNDDAGSTNFAHARTPARALHKHRSGALRENAVYHGSMTVKAKGKSVLHTPFNHARQAPQTAFKLKGTMTPSILVSRPLGDKTPFPNRQPPPQPLRTPKPQATKLLLEADAGAALTLPQTPECLLLPSATRRRKSLRLPSATSKNLKTPMTRGNHWDVSDGDMELDGEEGDSELDIGGNGARATTGGVELGVREEEVDEIEYMPPKVPEQPWTPPFDMPDYKTLGPALLRVAHGMQIDNSADTFYAQDIEAQLDIARLLQDSGALDTVKLDLPTLEDDDPFARAAREPHPFQPTPQATQTRAPSAASTRSTSRPGTALARPSSQSSARGRAIITPTPPVAAPSTRSRSALAAANVNSKLAASKVPATTSRAATTSAVPGRAGTAGPAAGPSTRRAQPPRMPATQPPAPAKPAARATSTRAATGRSTSSTDTSVPSTKTAMSRPTGASSTLRQGGKATGDPVVRRDGSSSVDAESGLYSFAVEHPSSEDFLFDIDKLASSELDASFTSTYSGYDSAPGSANIETRRGPREKRRAAA